MTDHYLSTTDDTPNIKVQPESREDFTRSSLEQVVNACLHAIRQSEISIDQQQASCWVSRLSVGLFTSQNVVLMNLIGIDGHLKQALESV